MQYYPQLKTPAINTIFFTCDFASIIKSLNLNKWLNSTSNPSRVAVYPLTSSLTCGAQIKPSSQMSQKAMILWPHLKPGVVRCSWAKWAKEAGLFWWRCWMVLEEKPFAGV